MGQKCSCFDKEQDTKTEKNIYDYSLTHRKDETNLDTKTKFKKVKEFQVNEKYDESMGLGNYENDCTKEKINMIISNISFWFLRKKFKENQKENLKENSENLFKEYFESEEIKKLRKIEQKITNKFDVNGWKEFYEKFPLKFEDLPKSKYTNNDFSNNINNKNSLDNLIYNNQYEEIFGNTKTKKLIYIKPENKEDIKFKEFSTNRDHRNNSYIYIGQVNNFGERHGRGIVYYLDGSNMEEGTWYNNILVGFCRKTLPNGVYYECKLFKIFDI